MDFIDTSFALRMTKLLDEEIEDDESFWNQDALKEVFSALYYRPIFCIK